MEVSAFHSNGWLEKNNFFNMIFIFIHFVQYIFDNCFSILQLYHIVPFLFHQPIIFFLDKRPCSCTLEDPKIEFFNQVFY